MNESYVLTQEDLDPGLDGHDFPAVKVAGNVDPAVLSSLLSCGWQKSPFYNTEPNNALALRYGPNAFMDFFMVYTTRLFYAPSNFIGNPTSSYFYE